MKRMINTAIPALGMQSMRVYAVMGIQSIEPIFGA